jgi:hypothetical protein
VVQGRKGQALLFHYSGDFGTAQLDPSSWRAGGVTDNGCVRVLGLCVCASLGVEMIAWWGSCACCASSLPLMSHSINRPIDRPTTCIIQCRFTTHTGCPVLEGSKLITAQWMRAGVSEKEPWHLYGSVGTALE